MVVPVDDLCCSSYDVDSDIMKILWLAFAYARMTVVSVGGKEEKKIRKGEKKRISNILFVVFIGAGLEE